MTRPVLRTTILALALIGSMHSHRASPSAHRPPVSPPAAAVMVGSTLPDAQWSLDRRPRPWQSEGPIRYHDFQRATEPEGESPDSGPELALLPHLCLDPGQSHLTGFRALSELSLDGFSSRAQAILRC